jgi:hypothetical protein
MMLEGARAAAVALTLASMQLRAQRSPLLLANMQATSKAKLAPTR